jgi:hypothetical protein
LPYSQEHPKDTFHRKHTLATPNYAYEKRQKELAKKRKKEEKLKKPKPDEAGHDVGQEPQPDAVSPAPPGQAGV